MQGWRSLDSKTHQSGKGYHIQRRNCGKGFRGTKKTKQHYSMSERSIVKTSDVGWGTPYYFYNQNQQLVV
jgi:hypothetical protein